MYEDFDPWREAHLHLDEDGDPYPGSGFTSGYYLYMDIWNYGGDTLKAIDDELYEL